MMGQGTGMIWVGGVVLTSRAGKAFVAAVDC